MRAYQLARFGHGFDGHRVFRAFPSRDLRRRLRVHVQGPYTLGIYPPGSNELEHMEGSFHRRAAVRKAKNILEWRPFEARVLVSGTRESDPKMVVRTIKAPPPEHPFIREGRKWIGHSSYLLGASGPPPKPSDCSGFVMRDVFNVRGISLPHRADLIQHDPRVQFFTDPKLVREGDFEFWHHPFSPRPLKDASHIEFVIRRGELNLGSRPSTNGVSLFDPRNDTLDTVLGWGRLRTGKPLT